MENHGCGSQGDLNFCLDSAKTGLSDLLQVICLFSVSHFFHLLDEVLIGFDR